MFLIDVLGKPIPAYSNSHLFCFAFKRKIFASKTALFSVFICLNTVATL